jgi:hypothetical protein
MNVGAMLGPLEESGFEYNFPFNLKKKQKQKNVCLV